MLRLEEQFGVVIDADTIAQLISVPRSVSIWKPTIMSSEPATLPVRIEFAPAASIPIS